VLRAALPRRALARLAHVTVLATAVALLVGTLAAPATAEPVDDEGGTKTLREQLDEAATAYQDAKAVLDSSQERELKLTVRLDNLEAEREQLYEEVQVVVAIAYRTGRVGAFAALINSSSPSAFLERAVTVDMIAKREQEMLANLKRLQQEIEKSKAEIEAEIELQRDEVAKLEAAKKQAEDALYAIGGGSSGHFVAYESPLAEPAPRNSDGSWPSETCSENDPTTSGCLTPRTLHAYNEARIFGFTRYTSCWRSGTFGEHPLGRACDFSAQPHGFGGAATGGDKEYGDRLASFFVTNADRLGVQYVIWYYQIWFPGSGWRAYGGAAGDPASNHTNHVHVSIR
jgi:peptidoglycan DL-endopeptidase CwlO